MEYGGDGDFGGREIGFYDYIPKFIGAAVSGALTGLFALAGAFTGAVTGALAGKASDSGLLRGAGLGAVAGAVLSVEVLEASRAYWYSQNSGSRSSSSMADFIEELLHERIIDQETPPVMLASYHWQQASFEDVAYTASHDGYSELSSRGLSVESMKKLPCHVVVDKNKIAQSTSCIICLQDLEAGEIARSLPGCRHTFHLACVDKWLTGHGSCPVCRQAL